MKRTLLILAAAALLLTSCGKKAPKLSIFAEHIQTIAKQESIPVSEAAAKVKAMGYTGADVLVTIPEEDLAALDELGFKHACAIVHFNFAKDDQAEMQKKALDFCKQHKYKTLLVVPGLLPEDYTDTDYNQLVSRFAAFVKKAQKKGITVVVEDYDNRRSPTFNTERIDHLFTEIPDLKLNFDTGNFVFAGDDVMTALSHFSKKIAHVHLKDRIEVGGRLSPAIGKGIVPFADVVAGLRKSGYKGWLTVEHFGSRQMLEDAAFSANTVLNLKKK